MHDINNANNNIAGRESVSNSCRNDIYYYSLTADYNHFVWPLSDSMLIIKGYMGKYV